QLHPGAARQAGRPGIRAGHDRIGTGGPPRAIGDAARGGATIAVPVGELPPTAESPPPPQAKYQGRHARSRRPATPPAVPLSAPVLVSQETAADHDQLSGPAPDKGHGPRRRVVTVVLPTVVGATVAAVAITLLTQHGPRPSHA